MSNWHFPLYLASFGFSLDDQGKQANIFERVKNAFLPKVPNTVYDCPCQMIEQVVYKRLEKTEVTAS